MPTWPDKSFAFVEQGGYLDKLATVYPAPSIQPRPLTRAEQGKVKAALNQRDNYGLLETLLSFKRFPFNDPYVSFLRKNPREISKNPQTVQRICAHLRQMGIANVVKGLEEPVQFNRRMGQMFRSWLRSKYVAFKDPQAFRTSTQPLTILDAPGEQLRQFANQIGCGLQKQPDLVAKANGRYVVGEAKFIGTEGGNQNRGFDDALNLASRSYTNAVTVAVLDGIVWIRNSGQMSRRLANFSGNALTALLLDDFFASL